MNQEPLPQIHLIRDTDLSVFAYELHIFAGDFLRECEFNMRSLATNIISQRVCRRNTDETRIVLLKVWKELYEL